MPHRCCVLNCNSGYTYKPGLEEKMKLFSTRDPKMQQKWTRIIPRNDYKVTSSYVCVKHFADEEQKNNVRNPAQSLRKQAKVVQ